MDLSRSLDKMAKGKMKQSQMYEADFKSGKLTRKSTFCPRCKGVFLAVHKENPVEAVVIQNTQKRKINSLFYTIFRFRL